MSNDSGLTAYRIGGGRRQPHWAHRWHVDRWFRSWQGESDNIVFCPRAWTEAGARRKARRWFRDGTDIKRHEQHHGRPNPELWAQRTAQR
jgi:hypothetical protein